MSSLWRRAETSRSDRQMAGSNLIDTRQGQIAVEHEVQVSTPFNVEVLWRRSAHNVLPRDDLEAIY